MDSSRRIIKNGAVLICNDGIEEVGKARELKKQYPGVDVIDAGGKMILPGFVNTHNHIYQTIMRGLSDDGEGKRTSKYRWDIDLLRGLTREACYASGMMSAVEMIRSGITTTQDSHYINFHNDSIDGIAESVKVSGLRLVLGRGSWDLPSLAPEELTEDISSAVKECKRVAERWHDGEMIKVIFEASLLSQVSDELIIETKEAARELGLGWAMHIQGPLGSHKDDPRSLDPSLKRYHGRAIEYLNNMGILGVDSLLVHCTFTTNREIPILAQTNTPVAHCPCANAWAGRSIVTPVPSMLDMGVNVGLGTDGALTNDSLDMFHAMNFCALIHKVNYGYTSAMTAEKVLEMSTITAAKALCIDHLVGSIEPGKKADLVLIDMRAPGMAPSLLPVKNLVYSASSSCVDTVIINGETVMKNRSFTKIDPEKTVKDAEKEAYKMLESSGHLEDESYLKRGGYIYL
jgi:5-methylthioadenosine/S-adenosylhomocysteine deaminase